MSPSFFDSTSRATETSAESACCRCREGPMRAIAAKLYSSAPALLRHRLAVLAPADDKPICAIVSSKRAISLFSSSTRANWAGVESRTWSAFAWAAGEI